MKSVINSVMPQATMVDYPGRLSGLMFTSGCSYYAENDTERGDMFCADQVLFTYDKMTGAVKKYSFSDVSLSLWIP